jgi:hypothetical protein
MPFSRCTDCHRDPHGGEVDRWLGERGCETCHRVESWRTSRFDHSLTRFALAGRHTEVSCRPCHALVPDPGTVGALIFAGVRTDCAACHADVHRGQFTESESALTDCRRCHATRGWKQLQFDHRRDARFPLDGAHARVSCDKCHAVLTDEAGSFTNYKPLDVKCASCHTDDSTLSRQERP